MKPTAVSIIIPVFNKCDLTLQCLRSLAQVSSHIPHEVIVVDNASTDATPRELGKWEGKIRAIRNPINRGFAAACNEGAAAATSKNLLFLNNDTIPLPGWLEAMLEEFRAHPEVAAVGAKLLYENGLVQHAGVAFARETRSPFHPYRRLRGDDPRVNHRRELQAVTAACILIRAKWFNDCGRFSEDFHNGYEDIDLCLKIRQAGGTIVYQPRSALLHLESQTPGRMKFDNENRALFYQRWADRVLSDEDAYYFADSYRSLGRKLNRPEEVQLVRLASDEERNQWAVVADAQRLAAKGRKAELIQRLADVPAWPQEAAIRRWAGVLCHRLHLVAAARRHFAMSLELEDDPDVRLYLDLASPSPRKWSVALHQACRDLQAGASAAAHGAFETALVQGAPPRLVMPGLWQAARESGQQRDGEVTTQALQAMPRLDPASAARLQAAASQKRCQDSAGRQPFTSVIILVLNQLEHTRKCLASLAACTDTAHEIIVVDNGSTDGSSEFLRGWQTKNPNHIVIHNRTNRGFAAGNNQGLAVARGECVVLLNNDTVVTEGWLRGMFGVLERHPHTGLVGPMSNCVSGAQLVRETPYHQLSELPGFAARWQREHLGQSFEVPRAVGFCLLATRALVERIGGLDECFGSGNFEDDDFCIRARLSGFGIRIAQAVFIHHTGSQTFKGANIDYRQAMLRNWSLFKTKWQMPAELPMEQGYRIPTTVPDSLALRIPLPNLDVSHQPDTEKRYWGERLPPPSKPAALTLPPSALLGQLGEARQFFSNKKFPAAWGAVRAALKHRPFHPEAYLLMAEIALAAHDAVSARACAQYARQIAPDFKPAKKFLKASLHGNLKPDWLVLPDVIRDPHTTRRPHLSVCLIVKNEERFIGQCLASVEGLADQIVVVDTGSTDRTVEIAKHYKAEVHSFTWCDDFSAARNAALEHVTGDWVLMLDADEELPPEQHEALRKLLRAAPVISWRLPLQDVGREAEGCSYVPRLFRNAPAIFYVGRVHEQVFTSLEVRREEWGMETRMGDAMLRHHGYTKELTQERDKVGRNLRLLEKAVCETPGDANLLMNYGLELTRSGRPEEGLRQYRAAFEAMADEPPALVVPESREMLLGQFCTQLMATKGHAEIVRVLTSPLAKQGTGLTASLHFTLGLAQMELKELALAAEQFRQCLAKRDRPALTPVNLEIRKAGPHHCLALCLSQSDDKTAAESEFQAARQDDPESVPAVADYARFLQEQGKAVEGLQLLHQFTSEHPQAAVAWQVGGAIALHQPEFLEVAVDWTAEALRHFPEDAGIQSQRAEALLLSGQPDAALPLWQQLKADGKPATLAALILCETAVGKNDCAAPSELAAAVTQEFVNCYRRLLVFGAEAMVRRVNAGVDGLAPVLPRAAELLRSVIAETNAPTA